MCQFSETQQRFRSQPCQGDGGDGIQKGPQRRRCLTAEKPDGRRGRSWRRDTENKEWQEKRQPGDLYRASCAKKNTHKQEMKKPGSRKHQFGKERDCKPVELLLQDVTETKRMSIGM